MVNPLDYPGWDESLLSYQNSSIFHSSGWAKAINDTYVFTPHYFMGMEEGRIVAAIPIMEITNYISGSRGVSLPFSDHCDPILPEGTDLKDIVRKVAGYGKTRGWKTLELRVRRQIPEEMCPYHSYFHHTLDLVNDETKMDSLLRENLRRNIRKAQNYGVKVEFSTTWDFFEKYYELHCLTRKDKGLPPPPISFFRNVHRNIFSHGGGIVALAYDGEREIAGGVFLHWGDRAYFKYGASDHRYLRLRANHLLMWEAIRRYYRQGFKSFSFGRTDMENEGLRRYKLSWGCMEDRIFQIKYSINCNKYVPKKSFVYGYHNKIIKQMPLGISKLIGNFLYKYMD